MQLHFKRSSCFSSRYGHKAVLISKTKSPSLQSSASTESYANRTSCSLPCQYCMSTNTWRLDTALVSIVICGDLDVCSRALAWTTSLRGFELDRGALCLPTNVLQMLASHWHLRSSASELLTTPWKMLNPTIPSLLAISPPFLSGNKLEIRSDV